MAKVRRWKETLLLACVTLFLSVAQGWPRGTRNVASSTYPVYSRLVTRANGKTALGVELSARKPYVRLVRASQAPVRMPLAAGAYVAMAGAPLAAPAAASAAASSCPVSCNTVDAPCCSITAASCCDHYCGIGGGSCYTVACTGGFNGTVTTLCNTCGEGTCVNFCNASY